MHAREQVRPPTASRHTASRCLSPSPSPATTGLTQLQPSLTGAPSAQRTKGACWTASQPGRPAAAGPALRTRGHARRPQEAAGRNGALGARLLKIAAGGVCGAPALRPQAQAASSSAPPAPVPAPSGRGCFGRCQSARPIGGRHGGGSEETHPTVSHRGSCAGLLACGCPSRLGAVCAGSGRMCSDFLKSLGQGRRRPPGWASVTVRQEGSAVDRLVVLPGRSVAIVIASSPASRAVGGKGATTRGAKRNGCAQPP